MGVLVTDERRRLLRELLDELVADHSRLQEGAPDVLCPFCGWDPTTKVGASWSLDIRIPQRVIDRCKLKGHVPSKNELVDGKTGRTVRWKYRFLRDAFFDEICSAIEKLPEACWSAGGHRRLIFTRRMGPMQREFDTANLIGGLKPVVDSLKKAGVIKDDSPKWLSDFYRQVRDNKNPGLTIEVQEVIDGNGS